MNYMKKRKKSALPQQVLLPPNQTDQNTPAWVN